jgi:hypothetical protein
MTEIPSVDLQSMIAEQRKLIERQQIELADLRSAVDRMTARTTSASDDTRTGSRRDLLKLAGGVAAGALGTALFTAGPAAAANADNLTVGAQATPDAGTTPTSGINFAGSGQYFGTAPHAVFSVSDDPAVNGISAAILGATRNKAALGVVGFGPVYDLFALGSGVIGFVPAVALGPPSDGQWRKGDLIVDAQGSLFVCVLGGSPGTWRELAGPKSAGTFHAISPQRVYDSRGGDGPLADGVERIVAVIGPNPGAPVVPHGANAVSITLTITETQGAGGFLAVRPAGTPYAGTSSINWFGPNQNIATTVISQLGADRQLMMHGGAAPTQFLVDVTGYYA